MTGAGSGLRLHATLARVASPDQLAAAWADVLASDRDDGVLGAGRLPLRARTPTSISPNSPPSLPAGSYRPGWLTPVALPRPDGQTRLLHVPPVRDRIVERSILAVPHARDRPAG